MKTDLYTKVVLTVIAFCLTIIVLNQIEIFPKAYAGPTPTSLKTNINYGLVPLNADGSIDVNLKSATSTIDVDIVDISTSDELEVNIEEVGGFSTFGTVPVKIK
jgi:hypothetical protein